MDTKVCEHCGREFSRPPFVSRANWPKRRFCTNACYLAAVQRSADCPVCGVEFKRRNGQQRTCGKPACRAEYRRTVSGPATAERMRADYAAGRRKRVDGVSPRERALWPFLAAQGWAWRLRWTEQDGTFELDFADPERKLDIEIDGIEHREPRGKRCDEARDAVLAARGWRVLRIPNEEVDADPEAVAARIGAWAG